MGTYFRWSLLVTKTWVNCKYQYTIQFVLQVWNIHRFYLYTDRDKKVQSALGLSFPYHCSLSQFPYREVTRGIYANPGWAIALLVHEWVTRAPRIKFNTKKPFTWPEGRERQGKRNCFTLEHGTGVRAQVQMNCFQDSYWFFLDSH